MVWLVNFVIISVFLVRIFVYGEPIMRRKSAVSESFWRHRKQADLCLAKVMCVCFVCVHGHVCSFVNVIILFVCNIVTFIENLTDSLLISKKRSWQMFSIPQGNYSNACHQYSMALSAIGRPLPSTVFEKVCSVMWQITRQILQRLYLGRWLAKHAGGVFLEQ